MLDSNYRNLSFNTQVRNFKINKFLKVLYDTILIFFDNKYLTANLYFYSIWVCYLTLKQHKEDHDEYL